MYKSAGFKVADVAGAFSSDDFTTQVNVPGAGEVPANVAKICQLTWACTKQDPHPNADGHKVIAGVFAAELAKNDAPGAGESPAPSEPATPGAGDSPAPTEPATPGAGESPAVSGSPTPGAGTDTEANTPAPNGDLAETGASSSTPVLAGAGLAVAAVGAAAVYYARRRRTGEES